MRLAGPPLRSEENDCPRIDTKEHEAENKPSLLFVFLRVNSWAVVFSPGLPSAMASILVFGPHPDDQELGMGGTVAKLAKQGHTVHLVDMTNGEPTPFGSVETRASEAAAAAKVLGVGRMLVGLK